MKVNIMAMALNAQKFEAVRHLLTNFTNNFMNTYIEYSANGFYPGEVLDAIVGHLLVNNKVMAIKHLRTAIQDNNEKIILAHRSWNEPHIRTAMLNAANEQMADYIQWRINFGDEVGSLITCKKICGLKEAKDFVDALEDLLHSSKIFYVVEDAPTPRTLGELLADKMNRN